MKTYDYTKQFKGWHSSGTISSGMFSMKKTSTGKVIPAGAFIRVKAPGSRHDELVRVMDIFKKALNEEKIAEKDFIHKSLSLHNCKLWLENLGINTVPNSENLLTDARMAAESVDEKLPY